METLKAGASKATSKAEELWNGKPTQQNNETSGEEPMSGGKGAGTVEDPYDQGNAEQRMHMSFAQLRTRFARFRYR